ncbi:hypothetical protein TKK_0013234 [Trichogramma kaykai]
MIFPTSKMESGDFFNPDIRVKEESRDDPLNDDDSYKIIDTTPVTQNIKYERFRPENSDHMLQEYDESHKNERDDIQIELECTDTKPNLLAVAKIEDFSPNHWQDSDDYKTGNKIKLENIGTVKKEILSEEATGLNFERGLNEKNGKECVEKSNYKKSLKAHADMTFRWKKSIKAHIDMTHNSRNQI